MENSGKVVQVNCWTHGIFLFSGLVQFVQQLYEAH